MNTVKIDDCSYVRQTRRSAQNLRIEDTRHKGSQHPKGKRLLLFVFPDLWQKTPWASHDLWLQQILVFLHLFAVQELNSSPHLQLQNGSLEYGAARYAQ